MSDAERAAMCLAVFEDILDECAIEAVFESHREEKARDPGIDIFGTTSSQNSEKYECENCHSMYPTLRYVPHLEKCLGLGGRQSSRVQRQRNAGGNDRASPSPFPNDSDEDSVAGDRKSGFKNNAGSGKRKYSPLRKSLGKKMKTNAEAEVPTPAMSPKGKNGKPRASTPSTPSKTNSILRNSPSPLRPGMLGGKTIPEYAGKGVSKTVPMFAEPIIDIDGDADAMGSDDALGSDDEEED
ncbi:hypothetical protein HK104_004402 [Borealophlyctis nickersoniae]|nr:hypothetical protein HK104_004402 [Borealophlyctis nickersoniae]